MKIQWFLVYFLEYTYDWNVISSTIIDKNHNCLISIFFFKSWGCWIFSNIEKLSFLLNILCKFLHNWILYLFVFLKPTFESKFLKFVLNLQNILGILFSFYIIEKLHHDPILLLHDNFIFNLNKWFNWRALNKRLLFFFLNWSL